MEYSGYVLIIVMDNAEMTFGCGCGQQHSKQGNKKAK